MGSTAWMKSATMETFGTEMDAPLLASSRADLFVCNTHRHHIRVVHMPASARRFAGTASALQMNYSIHTIATMETCFPAMVARRAVSRKQAGLAPPKMVLILASRLAGMDGAPASRSATMVTFTMEMVAAHRAPSRLAGNALSNPTGLLGAGPSAAMA